MGLTRRRQPQDAIVLTVVGGLFTIFSGFSTPIVGTLNPIALTVGLAILVTSAVLTVVPKYHVPCALIIVSLSLVHWTILTLVFQGQIWVYWGLTGPVPAIAGGILALLRKPR